MGDDNDAHARDNGAESSSTLHFTGEGLGRDLDVGQLEVRYRLRDNPGDERLGSDVRLDAGDEAERAEKLGEWSAVIIYDRCSNISDQCSSYHRSNTFDHFDGEQRI